MAVYCNILGNFSEGLNFFFPRNKTLKVSKAAVCERNYRGPEQGSASLEGGSWDDGDVDCGVTVGWGEEDRFEMCIGGGTNGTC